VRHRSVVTREREVLVLYLYANGSGSLVIAADTILRGVFGYGDGSRPPRALARLRKVRTMFSLLRDYNERLSYMADWKEAFLAAPNLRVEACNINNLVHYSRALIALRRYDVVVIAHSAAGDDMTMLSKSAAAFDRRRGPLVMFVGNEYDILDEKVAFIRKVAAEFICTQLPLQAAKYLYAECAGSRILEMPHALNPKSYFPIEGYNRAVDVGFIGDIYWPFVGDRERTDLIEWFERHGASHGLTTDIRRQRVGREEWNRFLNGCKAVIGAESGTYYLNERGRLLDRARTYNLKENPSASFEEVHRRFYAGQPRAVSGKSISSRHFEPIGAKTCQILLEGHYNGILRPNEHYIPVKKDLSDIDSAIERFKDEPARRRMSEAAYDYVMANHTYEHRVAKLMATVVR
jgi:hypothetical protein